MRFEAIRKVHPEVTSLEGDDIALDIKGNVITIDEGMVAVHVDIMMREHKEAEAIAKQIRDHKDKLANIIVYIEEITRSVEHPIEKHQEEVLDESGLSKEPPEFIEVIDVEAYTETIIDRPALGFDGNDLARQDMMSAIQASTILGVFIHNWKLADNTWAMINVNELREAHALAILAKGKILGA